LKYPPTNVGGIGREFDRVVGSSLKYPPTNVGGIRRESERVWYVAAATYHTLSNSRLVALNRNPRRPKNLKPFRGAAH